MLSIMDSQSPIYREPMLSNVIKSFAHSKSILSLLQGLQLTECHWMFNAAAQCGDVAWQTTWQDVLLNRDKNFVPELAFDTSWQLRPIQNQNSVSFTSHHPPKNGLGPSHTVSVTQEAQTRRPLFEKPFPHSNMCTVRKDKRSFYMSQFHLQKPRLNC